MALLPVLWRRIGVQPPSAQFVDADEGLFITVLSLRRPLDIEVNARMLFPDGERNELRYQLSVPFGFPLFTATFPLPTGFLLGLTVRAINLVNILPWGQTWVHVALARGLTTTPYPEQTIVASYISNLAIGSWPGGQLLSPQQSQGYGDFEAVATPLAGGDASYTVPSPAVEQLLSARFQLVTDATVANREVQIQFIYQGFEVFRTSSTVTQPGATTFIYDCSQIPITGLLGANKPHIPLPPGLWLPSVSTIIVHVNLIGANDQLSQIRFVVARRTDSYQ